MAPKIFIKGEKLEDGHYTVHDEIGVGGMGVVYHCKDELLLRDVAIKLLLPSLTADKKNIEVFKEEARLAAQLEHPNIVTVFDVGVTSKNDKEHHFVAMEYLPGGNLAQKLAGGPLPIEHALNWMKQLASGLSFAHKRGVVHQDIKADNIFITNEGDLKIGDFGLARLLVGRVYMNSSTKGMGTPAYMSPELCKGEPQDYRSDIYSMGILFYEMATGQLPYRANGMIEMAMKHTNAPIPSVRRVNAAIPEILDRVIAKMMAKLPDERYGAMSDVLDLLDDLIFEMRVARMGLNPSGTFKATQAKTADDENKIVDKDKSTKAPNMPLAPPVQQAMPKGAKPGSEKVDKSSDKVSLRWTFATKGPIGWQSSPVKGRDPKFIYTASSDGRLYINDIAGGALLHCYDLEAPALTSPLCLGDKVYLADLSGRIRALSQSDLNIVWSRSMDHPVIANPVASGGLLIVADKAGRLFALDSNDGKNVWQFDANAPILAAPRIHGDSVYFGTKLGHVFCLNLKTGRQKWRQVADGRIVSTPIASVDTVYLGTQQGTFFALDAESGRIVWEYQTNGAILYSGVISFTSVLFASHDRWLYCCEKYDGKLRWKSACDGPSGSNLQIWNEKILTISKQGQAQLFEDKTGKVAMRFALHKDCEAAPYLDDSRLYIGSVDGRINCLDLKKS